MRTLRSKPRGIETIPDENIDYSDIPECPKEEETFIRMGWGIGRQIVSQYVVEMLLQIRLKQQGVRRTETHNLAQLYRKLSEDDRNRAEKVYKQILNAEIASTWDVYETVGSFLDFQAKNPIKRTRYPWQQAHVGTLYSPESYRALVRARSSSRCTGIRSRRARWISATTRNSPHSRNPGRTATIARGTGPPSVGGGA